ncbi:unnamed protein product [Knipowitschia caucasica]
MLQELSRPIRLTGTVRDDGTSRWDLEGDRPLLWLLVDLGQNVKEPGPRLFTPSQERHFWREEFLWGGPL